MKPSPPLGVNEPPPDPVEAAKELHLDEELILHLGSNDLSQEDVADPKGHRAMQWPCINFRFLL